MSTFRETLARLGELASLATPGPWTSKQRCVGFALKGPSSYGDYESPYGISVSGEFKPAAGYLPAGPECDATADYIAAANPAVILALIKQFEELEAENVRLTSEDEVIQQQCSRALKQVEEMRKALEKIAGHSHLSVARQIVEEHRRIADDALRALDKEMP